MTAGGGLLVGARSEIHSVRGRVPNSADAFVRRINITIRSGASSIYVGRLFLQKLFVTRRLAWQLLSGQEWKLTSDRVSS